MTNQIWMRDEQVFGELLRMGPEFSLVRYTDRGTTYEIWVENDDFEFDEDDE